MRPMSREVLARDAAAKLTASGMPAGTCSSRGRLWALLERTHRRASRPAEAHEVIVTIREEFCGQCPARLACHNLATTSKYTGLAAGAAYEVGERQSSTWTVPRAGRSRARAS